MELEIREAIEDEFSEQQSYFSKIVSILEDNIGDDLTNRCIIQPSLLAELKSLKIKSNRGRPRKPKQNNANRYFKVPRKKKSINKQGLPIIPWVFNKGSDNKAEAVLETGLLMGLVQENSKDMSLQLIKENLQL